MSVAYRSTCRLTLAGYIDQDVLVKISTKISADNTSRLTHWPRVGRYVDRQIGQASVDMSTDISVEGCGNYT